MIKFICGVFLLGFIATCVLILIVKVLLRIIRAGI